ncbi:type VII secretion protein EccCa [Mycobacterium haemophilum]|uniref:Membrane protein n=1 Tax=Mycobacterium haemophilum TaxID=29311 RepID=A0A0I9V105_9MYCO|nr:type VII secretion protein EccCa [Mycobacterium haemophilum]KLO28666.1 membrane protein [Mycobacterium haemophilum]KLO35484.1 membrane protein [Mycobacterium haemophilum]KLO40719.1 membrane protein [Mycobacterium haemophilum]KLO48165.1 membrane protein [Mycobacterium haemophilum]
MSKRGFVRGTRRPPPNVTPVRIAVGAPLALPEREPRNILLMIAIPALLVGIVGTLVVMYASGIRSLQSGFFPMIGLVGFGTLMFSGRFGRGRRISWGEQEKQRRSYLRQLDEDRDEVQRAAHDQRASQLFVHGDPQRLDTVIGGPRMWERRAADPDFLDVRLGIGVQQASESAVSLQWPDVPIAEELEPVTGGALKDFILEQSKIRGIGKLLSLRSKPGFSFIGDDPSELHGLARSILCSLAVYHSPGDLKLMVVTRHPELWSWLVWLPHNQHDEMFDACGLRRLVFASPTELEEALDAELHRKGRGPWTPPVGGSPTSMPSPIESATDLALGPHWVIVDDNVGTPEQWEGVTGQKGMAGITVLRLATRVGVGIGFADANQRFALRNGRLTHRDSFYAMADLLAESTANRYARALARWSPMSAGELSATGSQGGELLRALGITDPRELDVDKLWAESRGRGDHRWAMVPVGVKQGGELQYVIMRAKDFGGYGFHSVVIGTSGSGKSEYFLSLCSGIALTHSPETFIVIFVDMKFESAAQDLQGFPHVAGSLSNLGSDDRHLAERMRKAINGEIARRYRLFKDAGARDANEYEEMRLAGRDLEPVPILLVIIDEYLELFIHHPEWIDLVIHIGQEGRGCNVFFTLGGQRLDLSSLSKVKSNIAFRVALRAETAEDSRDVIGSDSALHLPSKENGYALLKVGPRDLEQFRCFYVSAPFVMPKRPTNANKTVAVSFSQPRSYTWSYQPLSEADSAALAIVDEPEEPDEFLFHSDGFRKRKLVDVIRESLLSHPARPPHQIWLPPLEVSEPIDSLVARWRGKPWDVEYGQNPGLVFPIGIVDIPEEHAQRVHVVDAEMDNVMVVATAQRGKSTTLMALMTSAALMYRPERVTFFCIGASLYPIEELPHVASVVSQTDSEGVSRTVASIEGLIAAREAAFKQYQIDISEFRDRRFGPDAGAATDPDDKFGDVFLVIDNFSDLYDKGAAIGDRVIAIARQGLSYGVHVVTSATAWLVGQKQQLVNVSNARIQLRLSNPDETQMGEGFERRKAARNTLDRPGFGVTRDGYELLVGIPELTTPAGERVATREIGALIADLTGAGRLEKLARLPERIQLSQVIGTFVDAAAAADPLNIPFGIGETALKPAFLATRRVPNMLVLGRQLCGKTTTLAAFGQAITSRFAPDQAQITIVDPKTSLIGKIQGPHVRAYAYTHDDIDAVIQELAEIMRGRLPPSGLSQEELLHRSTWQGPRHFLLIDDEQELRPHGVIGKGAATAPLWGLIERSREIGLHIIAARLPGNWAGVSVTNPFLQKMTSSRAPTLFMDNDPAAVKVFGRISAQQLPPGRGLLVTTDGVVEGVLVGTPE